MTEKKFNIIIPSISLDSELLSCLQKINKINYKNFFVTIVLDKGKNTLRAKDYKFKINFLISKKKNMSAKRNLGAKSFLSDYLAFLDSDAYPNKNWLKNANNYFQKNKILVMGGPNIPFPEQKELISHYCKRSFFLNGHLFYRKFKSKKKYINDWLESCNILICRKLFLENNGMNESIYIGEDQDFFKKLILKNKDTKILFCPTLLVFHRERSFKKLTLQRLSFGMDVFSGFNIYNGFKGTLVCLPLITLIGFFIFFYISNGSLFFKFQLFGSFLLLINFFIIYEISRYVKSIKKIILTTFALNYLNLIYAIGGVFTALGLRKFTERKVYLKSRL